MRKMILLLAALLIGTSAFASVAIRCDTDVLLLREDGTVLIGNDEYSDIEPVGNELFAIRKDNLYAVADNRGKVLTDFEYTSIVVRGDMVCVGANGIYGLIDLQGETLTDRIYSKIVMGDDGSAWALRSDGDQLITLTREGAAYAPLGEVDAIADVSDGDLLAVRMSESMKWGYCNRSGRMVIRDRFDFADRFIDGIARVTADGAFGVIDKSGEEIVPCEYERLEIGSNLIAAQSGETTVVFGREGNELMRYEQADNGFALFDDKYAIFGTEAIELYEKDGKLIELYSADTQLTAGINGGLLISEGFWGEKGTYLYGAKEELWLDLTPLGTANGNAVYRGTVADVTVSRDSLLNENIYSIDPSETEYMIVSDNGKAISDDRWKAIVYLADDRFLIETDTQWRMIDSKGNIFFALDKKVT